MFVRSRSWSHMYLRHVRDTANRLPALKLSCRARKKAKVHELEQAKEELQSKVAALTEVQKDEQVLKVWPPHACRSRACRRACRRARTLPPRHA